MASIEITNLMKTLRTERAQMRKELAKLDKATSALGELSGTTSLQSSNGMGRTLSVAARRKIGMAQKARWAKMRQQRASKG
jgi:hypothetical protein